MFDYKDIILIIALFTLIIFFFIRFASIKKQKISLEKYKTNVFDLNSIYEGTFVLDDEKLAFIEEDAVDYDLLNRDEIIGRLYYAIRNVKPERSFVISLEGRWGSGKTTILNNVKTMLKDDKQSIIIIDEFNPWIFDNEIIMFRNMLSLLLKKSGYNLNLNNSRRTVEAITETIFGGNKTKLINALFLNTDEGILLKQNINDFLKNTGKRFIFFIDNTDRADSKNVILLFKIIASILDFERVTYVLSYDDTRVREIFKAEGNIDYNYLKKIIQIQMVVPELDKHVLNNLYSKCINNLLSAMAKNKENIGDINFLINNMCVNLKDIRDFKRFVNTVISLSARYSHYLYNRDVVTLAYIRFFNQQLYNEIFMNKKYFISHDINFDNDLYIFEFNRDEFNKNAKQYFVELFADEKNQGMRSLIADMFPNVKRYHDEQDIKPAWGSQGINIEYYEIARMRKICSAKYFDLYFTNSKNAFTEVGRQVEHFLNNLQFASSIQSKSDAFIMLLENFPQEFQREIIERIEVYVEELSQSVAIDLAKVIFNESIFMDDTPLFLALTPKRRSEFLIWSLLQKSSESDFQDFLSEAEQKYSYLNTVSGVLYWSKNGSMIDVDGARSQYINDLLKRMCENIIINDIDLYSDQYYSPKNVYALLTDKNDVTTNLRDYVNPLLSKDNVFRVLLDTIGCEIGSDYTYKISRGSFELLTTKDQINKILETTKPQTKIEEFILSVYDIFKDRIGGKGGVVRNEPIKFDLKEL